MKNKKIIKNKNAVSAPLDFMVAFSIVIIGIFLLMYTLNSLFIIYENPEPDLNSKATEIANILITNPGYMADNQTSWENEKYPADKLLTLGFSKDNNSIGVLSLKKIKSFEKNVTMDNYSQIRQVLGLTGQIYYDYNITITDLRNDSVLLNYGRNYQNEDMVSSFSRYTRIENYDHNVKIKVNIF